MLYRKHVSSSSGHTSPSSPPEKGAPCALSGYLSNYVTRHQVNLLVLLPLRLLSAVLTPIADCDETFNYWEPTHHLLHTHAFQTWEYSPDFALRSYFYLLPYALVLRLSSILLPSFRTSPKIAAFYTLRLILALLTALAECFFISASIEAFSPDVGGPLLLFLVSSPGMFRAAVEFLPSSFAMTCLLLAFGLWMTKRYPAAIFSVAVAALVGWIYAAVLAVPMAVHIILSNGGPRLFVSFSVLSAVLILSVMTAVDSFIYGKLVVAPINHFLYNVFPKEGAGSELFGVESVSYYVINLVLNCNVAAFFFATFPPTLIFCHAVAGRKWMNTLQVWKRVIFLSPSYLCIAIFASQPHKEERFLAPCYPFIALIAAVAFVDTLRLIQDSLQFVGSEKVVHFARLVLQGFTVLACIAFGASRIAMQVKGFYAPLKIYNHLSYVELQNGNGPILAPEEFKATDREINICVGKEWYRFPTSFFLPHRRFRLRFVRAGFSGLLPKPYFEDATGTSVAPPGMNEFNQEDRDQFFDWTSSEGCHYYIDLNLEHRPARPHLNYSDNSPIPYHARHVVASSSFLDSEMSRPGFRAFYVPFMEHKVEFGDYELIRNLDLLPLS